MASLMEDLLEVLHKETEQYAQLIELSGKKTDALIAANIQDIQDIAEVEQSIVGVIQQCEKKCDEVIKDMGIVLGRDMEDLNVMQLIEMLGKQPVEQEKLREAYEELLAQALQMKQCNEKNQLLVEQALEMVEFDLTLFRSLRTAPETANYSKDALTASQIKGTGRFDKKQ